MTRGRGLAGGAVDPLTIPGDLNRESCASLIPLPHETRRPRTTALPYLGMYHGRATIPGRRNAAHREGHPPNATTQRSRMTALPIIASREGDRPRSPWD
jgi:hypothetical protein